MGELEAVASIVDSKVAERAYEDAVSEPAKQVGQLGADVLKAFRLFTAPIQLLAVAQDRFGRWLDGVRAAVPKERQIEAAPEIAGPVLMNLRFMSEDNELRTLYLNLLKLAIDRDHCDEAHPGFIKIIEQLSPSDAHFLHDLTKISPVRDDSASPHDSHAVITTLKRRMSGQRKRGIRDVQASLDLLSGLSVINVSDVQFANDGSGPDRVVQVRLTEFGKKFVDSCIPGERKDGSSEEGSV